MHALCSSIRTSADDSWTELLAELQRQLVTSLLGLITEVFRCVHTYHHVSVVCRVTKSFTAPMLYNRPESCGYLFSLMMVSTLTDLPCMLWKPSVSREVRGLDKQVSATLSCVRGTMALQQASTCAVGYPGSVKRPML
jgi:hypothetical protein